MNANDFLASSEVRAIPDMMSLGAKGASVHLLRGGLQLTLLSSLGDLRKLRRVGLVAACAHVMRV